MLLKNRIKDISSFFKIICFFFIISQVFHFVGYFVHFSYPLFYWDSSDNFADWFKVMDALKIVKTWNGTNPYATIGINHMPPFAVSIYVAMALAIKKVHLPLLASYFFIVVVPFFIVLLNKKHFATNSSYWFLFLTSYPVLFMLKTGNMAVLVFLFLVLFIINIRNIAICMLFLALAASIKITPIIFFIYFIVYYRHNFRNVLKGGILLCVFLFIVNYLSVILIANTVDSNIYSINNFFNGIKRYEELYVEQSWGLAGGSSFYMAFRCIIEKFDKAYNNAFFNYILAIKPLIINFVVLTIIGVFYFLKFSWQDFKKVILDRFIILKMICIIFVLFTPVTADYYLSVLLIPLFFVPFKLFLDAEKLIYLLLLISKNYFILPHGLSFQVFINPLLMICLILVTLKIYDFSSPVLRNNSKKSITYSNS